MQGPGVGYAGPRGGLSGLCTYLGCAGLMYSHQAKTKAPCALFLLSWLLIIMLVGQGFQLS